MNASFGSIGSIGSIAALLTGNSSGANAAAGAGAMVAATAGAKTEHPAQAKGGSPFAGLIGVMRGTAIAGGIAPGGPAPSGAQAGAGLPSGANAAKMELLSDIVALAMQAQQAFANGQPPRLRRQS
jgi:hypothetical protein